MSAVPSTSQDPRIAALEGELAYHQRNLAALLAVTRATRGVTDPNVVLNAIYRELSAMLPVDAFSVVLSETDHTDTYRYMLQVDEGIHYEEVTARTGGLTGYILEHQEPLFFRDLHVDYPDFLPRPSTFGNATRRSRSWMGVPLLAGRATIGAITVQSYRPDVYTQADLELVSALADLAAVAIENAVLYEQQNELAQSLAERVTARQEELAVLSALAAGLSHGPTSPQLLNEALERVLWLFGLDGGIVWLHDQRGALLRAAWRATGQLPDTEARLAVDAPSLEADALRAGDLRQQVDETGRWVCVVPLQAHGRYVGVLTLWGGRELQATETALLDAAADQVALGIENGRLLQERDRQIHQLEALSIIAEACAATRDVRVMLRSVFHTLQEVLDMDGFMGALYDHTSGWLQEGIAWQRRAGEREIEGPVHGSSAVEQLVQAPQPLLMTLSSPSQLRDWWEADAVSWLGVPLLGNSDEPIGVLAIQHRAPEAFNQHDLQFISNVAHQLTLHLLNAQLYSHARLSAAIAERRANNLALVHSISRLVNSSLDPAEVLRIAAEQLTRLFAVDHGCIMLWSSDRTTGQVVAEFPALSTLNLKFDLKVNDRLEAVPGSGEPIFITDIANDPRLRSVRGVALELGIQALLLIPLIARGYAYGVISLNLMQNNRSFTAEDYELCRTVAAQVTTALENARLHQMQVTRVEQELEIARSIQANLFPRTLPTIPGVELAARCVPAFETGGDFFDVLSLGDSRWGIIVGDVSGKSLSAAMVMAVARSIARSEALDHAAPETVMVESNYLIAQDVPPLTFVAMCYAVYDACKRELVLANAGQINPLLRRPDGQVEWLPITGSLPLGIVPDLEYEATTVSLNAGDTVLFLTDGLAEAFTPDREMFGLDRVAELFGSAGNQAPRKVVDTLIDAVCSWQGDVNRHDDMTAIVLHVL